MPTLLQSRDDVASSAPAPARRPRRRVPGKLIAAGAAVAVAVPVVGAVAGWISDWSTPFEETTIDRSTTPLLVALEDLEEYHAATGTFQVVIDQERDVAWVPSFVSGERVQFLAVGTVDAYVDFSDLDEDRVALSETEEGTSATITLPAPQLGDAHVDPDESRLLDSDRGLVQRVGDLFADSADDQSGLYADAEDELAGAAAHSDLLDRAEDNTRDMLTALAGSLGVDSVTVEFEEAPGAGS
ncbi:DUF4230 domain-containing protein [Blastococcus sp. SYSU D00820]